MGRVGSSAVHAGITMAMPLQNVLHVHSINPHLLAKLVAKSGGLESAARSVLDGLEAVRATIGLGARLKIISLVRDKIDRNYSAAFADFADFAASTAFRSGYDVHRLKTALATPDAAQLYWRDFYKTTPDTWFQNEFEAVFGLDVYSSHFPDKGWHLWNAERYDIIILRSEKPNIEKQEIISDFLGKDILLNYENSESSQSALKPLYEKFKDFNQLDREEIEKIAVSKYMAHFYAPDPQNYVKLHLRSDGSKTMPAKIR